MRSPSSTPSPSTQFANILQGILGVWNGRLVPLAPALIAAGISSWADWGRLFDMPQIALDATLDPVHRHAVPAQGGSAAAQYWDELVSLLAAKIRGQEVDDTGRVRCK